MEADIFEGLTNQLSEILKSIRIDYFHPTVVKISECSSKGDVSFYVPSEVNNEILEFLKKSCIDCELTIDDIIYSKNHIMFTLNRPKAFAHCIKTIHQKAADFGRSNSHTEKKVTFTCDEENDNEDFTNFRIHLLIEVAKNLSSFVGFVNCENNSDDTKVLHFTHKSNTPKDQKKKIILCGVVQNSDTKLKESAVSISEYKRLKNKLLIMEMKDRDKFSETVTDLLTDAVLKFNLLRVKINSPVAVNFQSHLDGSDSAAIFIMYNYSRLNAIIYEYDDRVQKKYYPSLPPIEVVDFSVLCEEKEWSILFNFVLQFPSAIRNSIENIEAGKFAPHFLYNFLHNMARLVSSYYRSTKILLDNRPQLLPLIFARMYLIKVIHQVFSNGIKLLCVKPVPAV